VGMRLGIRRAWQSSAALAWILPGVVDIAGGPGVEPREPYSY